LILGLDISTSITGYAIIDLDGKIIEIGSWDLRNKKQFPDFYSKVKHCKERLKDISFCYVIESIFIEPALNMFMMGKSSSHTISTLIKFNGILSWLCCEEFGYEPKYIPAISARKKCGISVKRGQKAKEIVMKFLLDNEPNFVVEYTKHGNPKPQYYDQADALIIARAGLTCLKETSGS
jgi:Holliday junction resolvasome RuvABC endonuclease subunit